LDNKTIHSVLRRNAFWSLFRHGVVFSIVFVLTPIIIKAIGDAQYGLWMLIFSIVGYAGLLEMGVQQATIKLVSEYHGKGDSQKLNIVASAALSFFIVIGLLVAMLCWFVLPHYMYLFVEDPSVLALTGPLLQIVGTNIILVFVANVFIGIALGLHQYHLRSLLDIVIGVARLAFTILILEMGYGLLGIAWLKLLLDAAVGAAMWLICRYSFKELRLSPFLLSSEGFKILFSYGGKIFLGSGMERLYKFTTPIAISFFLSTIWTAYYSVADRLTGYLNEIVWAVSASFLPMFSELKAQGEHEVVQNIYVQYTRYILIFSMPLFTSLIFLGPAFLNLWIGNRYATYAGPVLILLSLSAMVAGLQPLLGRLMIGSGNLNFYVRIRMIVFCFSMILGVAFIPWLGIIGPPAVQVFSTFLMQLIFFLHIDRRMHIFWKEFLVNCHLRLLIPVGVYALSLALIQNFIDPSSYFHLIATASIPLLIYLPAVFFLVLTKKEGLYLIYGILSFFKFRHGM